LQSSWSQKTTCSVQTIEGLLEGFYLHGVAVKSRESSVVGPQDLRKGMRPDRVVGAAKALDLVSVRPQRKHGRGLNRKLLRLFGHKGIVREAALFVNPSGLI
jgi:hypothetical protein